MQIQVLSQKIEGGSIKATAAFWRDGVPTSEPALFVQDFDLQRITAYEQRVVDAAGMWITRSGRVVLPVVERADHLDDLRHRAALVPGRRLAGQGAR